MNKILRIVLILLFVISAIFTLLFYAGGRDVSDSPIYTDAFLMWAYILSGIAVGLTLIFAISNMVTNIKKAKKGLLGLIGLVVVLGIAYAMSSGEVLGITNPDLVQYDVPSTLKYAGTALNSVYILSALAILAMIYTGIAKIFK